MPRPTPVPSQCKHERTYYDEKGLRCKGCGVYIRRFPLPGKGSQAHDEYDPPLEVEFPELWAEPPAWAEAAEEMGVEGW